MNSVERLDLLNVWAQHVSHYEGIAAQLEPMFGTVADMPLYEKITDLLVAYTESISTLVGDNSKWLDWFHWENDMGKSSLDVTFDTTTIKVKTLGDLLAVIEATLAKDATPNV